MSKGQHAPNLDAINEMVATLSNDIANLECKNKELEKKYKEANEASSLLSKEIQEKAVEITNLKAENEKHIKTILELNKKIEEDKKQIEELDQMKRLQNEQNYGLMVELKNKAQKERDDLEKQYLEMKKKYEEEHQKYDNLDKIFTEYKQEKEKGKEVESNKMNQLDEQNKKLWNN